MKLWIMIYRASEDAALDGIEDEVFLYGYKKLERAQKEATAHIAGLLEDEPEAYTIDDCAIDWAETTDIDSSMIINEKSGGKRTRKFLGRPKAEVDGYFEVYEIEVVNEK